MIETPAISASLAWSQPSSALPARIWMPEIMACLSGCHWVSLMILLVSFGEEAVDAPEHAQERLHDESRGPVFSRARRVRDRRVLSRCAGLHVPPVLR